MTLVPRKGQASGMQLLKLLSFRPLMVAKSCLKFVLVDNLGQSKHIEGTKRPGNSPALHSLQEQQWITSISEVLD
jgi:hypothetical protein